MSLKIAILASGSGSNAQAIIDKINSGSLDATVNLVFSNRPEARVLERAKKANIAHAVIDHNEYPDRIVFDRKIAKLIHDHDCDFVVLAGFMRILGKEFLQEFQGRIVNIHPALLPSFPGTHGINDALNYGSLITGVSVHFVEEKMDSGPLIIQGALPILPGESLEALSKRIHAVEHRIYPQALQWFAEGRINLIDKRHVVLKPGNKRILPLESLCLINPPLEQGF